jgi:membrane protein implicated in regulation of membrane protease activity
MGQQQPPNKTISKTGGLDQLLLGFAPFFEKALDILKPPMMKFSIALIVPLLLFLVLFMVLVMYLSEGENAIWGLVLLIVGLVSFVLVILFFFGLVFVLQYVEVRFRYTKRTEEELKEALRDTVMQLQKEGIKKDALSSARIVYVEHDPRESEARNEFVAIENVGDLPIDVTNWTLCDKAGHQFTFPALTLKAGARVRVWTSSGTNTSTDLYWGRDLAVWNNEGDQVFLRNDKKEMVHHYRC